MALADQVVVMNAGRIEQQGTPHEVFNAPRTEFVARFMGGHNVLPAGGAKVAVRSDRTLLTRGAASAGEGLAATVQNVEYQGTYVLVTLASNAGEVAAMLPEGAFDAAPWAPGEAATVSWLPAHAHALSA